MTPPALTYNGNNQNYRYQVLTPDSELDRFAAVSDIITHLTSVVSDIRPCNRVNCKRWRLDRASAKTVDHSDDHLTFLPCDTGHCWSSFWLTYDGHWLTFDHWFWWRDRHFRFVYKKTQIANRFKYLKRLQHLMKKSSKCYRYKKFHIMVIS